MNTAQTILLFLSIFNIIGLYLLIFKKDKR